VKAVFATDLSPASEAALDRHAETLRSIGLTVRTRVEQGSTAQVIHRVADEEGAMSTLNEVNGPVP